ncbi:MAG: hypothetical protein JW993_09695 [Sedimentisphaerales bacterium]|nr:hypothetical protein [Sedimentisphaerales bacterium]
MHTQVRAFWRATWIAWKSGALSEIFPGLKQVASVSFLSFLDSSTSVRDPALKSFLSDFEPRRGEFLIVHEDDTNSDASFVITSQRLFLTEGRGTRYAAFDLDNIAAFHAKGIWSSTIQVVDASDKKHTFKKLEAVPKHHVLQFAIDQARHENPWQDVVARCEEAGRENEVRKDNRDLAPIREHAGAREPSNTWISASGKTICDRCRAPLRRVRTLGQATDQIICMQCEPPNGKCPVCGAALRTSQAQQCSKCKSSWYYSVDGLRLASLKSHRQRSKNEIVTGVLGLGVFIGGLVLLPLWALRNKGFPVNDEGPQLVLESVGPQGWQFSIRHSTDTDDERRRFIVQIIPEKVYDAYAAKSFWHVPRKLRRLVSELDHNAGYYALPRREFEQLKVGRYYARVGGYIGSSSGWAYSLLGESIDYKEGVLCMPWTIVSGHKRETEIERYRTGPFIELVKENSNPRGTLLMSE